MEKKTEIVFILQGIKTEQFALLEENYTPKLNVDLGTELQVKIDQADKKIGVFLGFEFLQEKRIFIKIVVSCHFQIKDQAWISFINKKNDSLVVPKGILAHLAMITTGTSRGILFAKTEGTLFSKFIIPTLNVEEMIPEDISFDITEE